MRRFLGFMRTLWELLVRFFLFFVFGSKVLIKFSYEKILGVYDNFMRTFGPKYFLCFSPFFRGEFAPNRKKRFVLRACVLDGGFLNLFLLNCCQSFLFNVFLPDFYPSSPIKNMYPRLWAESPIKKDKMTSIDLTGLLIP